MISDYSFPSHVDTQRPPAIHGRASPRRKKKDRGLQLHSLLTSHDNKRARHRIRRLSIAPHSNSHGAIWDAFLLVGFKRKGRRRFTEDLLPRLRGHERQNFKE